jgi:RND family efflux transporter MFP subunit
MMKEKSKSTVVGGGIKLVVIVAVLLVGVFGMKWLKENGPEAGKESPPVVVPVVRVVKAEFSERQLYVETQGRVAPRMRTQAAAEVRGRVTKVSPKFKSGGVFQKDEIMLEIDDADYVAALAVAESALTDARLALEREEARAAQARRDWKKLGRGEPSALVLGKPQIASAKARVKAGLASVEKAKRDVVRTKLRAPYDCLVEKTYTDLGSYIVPGARLADLYSTDSFEVRVPVTLEEFAYLPWGGDEMVGVEVTLQARIGGGIRHWNGRIVRSEGQVDRSTMTMYQVVKILPNAKDATFTLPPSGLFVRAKIKGRVMPRVCELPRSTLRPDGTLLVMGENSLLQIVPVEVARTLEKHILVTDGLKPGDRVIVSPMETPVAGMKLQALESSPRQ